MQSPLRLGNETTAPLQPTAAKGFEVVGSASCTIMGHAGEFMIRLDGAGVVPSFSRPQKQHGCRLVRKGFSVTSQHRPAATTMAKESWRQCGEGADGPGTGIETGD
jgi:hypothetical protein